MLNSVTCFNVITGIKMSSEKNDNFSDKCDWKATDFVKNGSIHFLVNRNSSRSEFSKISSSFGYCTKTNEKKKTKNILKKHWFILVLDKNCRKQFCAKIMNILKRNSFHYFWKIIKNKFETKDKNFLKRDWMNSVRSQRAIVRWFSLSSLSKIVQNRAIYIWLFKFGDLVPFTVDNHLRLLFRVYFV